MSRFKGYIILGTRKDGSHVGYCENSFSMGFDNKRVNVWRHSHWSGSNKSAQEQKQSFIDNVIQYKDDLIRKHPQIEWNVYRVGSKNCPVKINWKSYWNMFDKNKKWNHRKKKTQNCIGKYEWRNLKFIKRVD